MDSPKNLELHDERITRAEAKLLHRQIMSKTVLVKLAAPSESKLLEKVKFTLPAE